MAEPKIAIIGGGPGGLFTAYLLRKRAAAAKQLCQITLFESASRLGGKVLSKRFRHHDVPYEAGAAELYDYSQQGEDPLLQTIREFGLVTRPLNGRTVVMDGHFIKTEEDAGQYFGPETAAALREFSIRAKALISPADYYESDWKTDNADPLAAQSFADFLAAVPDEAARRYIQVAIHSDLATEPHSTNAMYGLANYLMNEPGYMRLYTIDGGLERLTHELVDRIDARVQLNQRIQSVEKIEGDRYRLGIARHAKLLHEDFDFVVAALPNGWLMSVDWQGESLNDAMRAHHKHYDHPAHYLRVSLLFQHPYWRDQVNESYFMLDAFGGCCVYDESSRHDGMRFGVQGWLLGGEAALTLSNLTDAELIERVLDALPTSLQHGRELFIEGQVHRWVGAVNALPGGYPMREPDSRHQPEPINNPSLFVVGDYLFDSTINGVVDSADTVAEWIVEEMEAP